MLTMKRELRDAATIKPSFLYPFSVAALFIPSHMHDGPVTTTTLRNWRREKRFQAEYRPRKDGRKAWFIRGEQILQLISVEPASSPVGRKPAKGERKGGAVNFN
jgi:hypothetical protein